jgi:hypothetical protein
MDVGVTHEIMGVLTPQQVKDLREEMDLDPRLFQSEKADGAADGIEFETPDETPPVPAPAPAPAAEVPEIDIDNI